MRARRRDQLELIASYALPDQPSAQVLERKLTLGSCCARVCSALRVVRPSVVVSNSGVASWDVAAVLSTRRVPGTAGGVLGRGVLETPAGVPRTSRAQDTGRVPSARRPWRPETPWRVPRTVGRPWNAIGVLWTFALETTLQQLFGL